MEEIHERFDSTVLERWHVTERGRGAVVRRNGELHLTLERSDDSQYCDAQITNYKIEARDFTMRPPLRLTVRAYSTVPSDQLQGTAGFGFWNHPFMPGQRGVRLPQALWFFFASPQSNMALAQGVSGNGWKAATFNARRWQFLSLLPTAPVAVPLMHIRPLYNALWPVGQRALGVNESRLPLDLLDTIHTYTLEWLPEKVTFKVDDVPFLVAEDGLPVDPLGFIVWLDNQYAIVTPQGKFRFGFVEIPQVQALVISEIKIESLR